MDGEKIETGTCRFCLTTVKYPLNFSGRVVPCPKCGSDIVIGFKKRLVTFEDVFHNVGPKTPIIEPFHDLSSVHFISTHHRRYNQEQWDGQVHYGSTKIFTIFPDEEYDNSYIVTLYTPDTIHPQFGDNLSMSPKRMEVILSVPTEGIIKLQGYGSDPLLSSRPAQIQNNYLIILQFDKSNLVTISLLILDRQVRIVYYQ